jgi:hypothetical protein
MKSSFSRLIAVLMLAVPGLIAAYGFLLMKNALFDYMAQYGAGNAHQQPFQWGKMFGGLILFGAGAGFIGGWIFYRDRKRNYVAPRFKEKGKRPIR